MGRGRLAPARSWGRPLRISGAPRCCHLVLLETGVQGKEVCRVKVSLKVGAGGTLWRTSWAEAVVLAGGPLAALWSAGWSVQGQGRARPDGATPRWMLLGTEEVLRRSRKAHLVQGGGVEGGH